MAHARAHRKLAHLLARPHEEHGAHDAQDVADAVDDGKGDQLEGGQEEQRLRQRRTAAEGGGVRSEARRLSGRAKWAAAGPERPWAGGKG